MTNVSNVLGSRQYFKNYRGKSTVLAGGRIVLGPGKKWIVTAQFINIFFKNMLINWAVTNNFYFCASEYLFNTFEMFVF